MTVMSLMIALRGVLELALWLLIGRAVLLVLAGRYGTDNPVARMFDFFLRPVRACSVLLMPGWQLGRRDIVSFVLLLVIWFGLGVAKLMVGAG